MILVATFLLVFLGGAWARADAPQLPAACWGRVVYSDNTPVVSGSVEAVINGAVCGRTTIQNGLYAQSGQGPKLIIVGNSDTSGSTVQFRVKIGNQTTLARETMIWESGSVSQLDLSLTINSADVTNQDGGQVPDTPSTGETTGDGSHDQSGTPGTDPGTNTGTPGAPANNNNSTSPDSSGDNSGGNQTGSNNTGGSTTPTNTGGNNGSSTNSSVSAAGNTGSTGNNQPANPPAAAGSNTSVAPLKQFKDLPATHWANQVMQFMVARQVINGMDANHVAPDSQVSRAQFVTMLVKAMGLSLANTNSSYQDVQAGSWYHAYVETASQAGLINGYGNSLFVPEGNISREQMAVILVKALQKKSSSPALTDSETALLLSTYPDRNQLSDWSKASMAWAVKNGLISGYPNGTLAPRNTATRAEAAVMLHKYMQSAGLI